MINCDRRTVGSLWRSDPNVSGCWRSRSRIRHRVVRDPLRNPARRALAAAQKARGGQDLRLQLLTRVQILAVAFCS